MKWKWESIAYFIFVTIHLHCNSSNKNSTQNQQRRKNFALFSFSYVCYYPSVFHFLLPFAMQKFENQKKPHKFDLKANVFSFIMFGISCWLAAITSIIQPLDNRFHHFCWVATIYSQRTRTHAWKRNSSLRWSGQAIKCKTAIGNNKTFREQCEYFDGHFMRICVPIISTSMIRILYMNDCPLSNEFVRSATNYMNFVRVVHKLILEVWSCFRNVGVYTQSCIECTRFHICKLNIYQFDSMLVEMMASHLFGPHWINDHDCELLH